MSENRLMKDGLNQAAIDRIGRSIGKAYPDFDTPAFSKDATTAVDGLELKQRVEAIIKVLSQYLPEDFTETAEILLRLKPVWERGDDNDALQSFAAWPVIDYVAVYGLDHPELALSVLAELTELFSAEFAIRAFYKQHYELTYQQALKWTQSDNYHIRRLASEGARPRLPWGVRLPAFINDPEPLKPLLDVLKDDPEDYVHRSVANNLNDISKDHPDWVVALCQQWMDTGAGQHCQWVIKHASRSLVKQGHPEVYGLLGYDHPPTVQVTQLMIEQTEISVGDSLAFELSLKNTGNQSQRFVLDFVIHYMKANGSLAPKVFKLKNIELAAGETLSLSKQQSFKPISTRKYYSGQHRLGLLVNGQEVISQPFTLMPGA